MYLFEKIFQRNDKFFLQVYYLTLGLLLNIGSFGAYYLRNLNWDLTDAYIAEYLTKDNILLSDWIYLETINQNF